MHEKDKEVPEVLRVPIKIRGSRPLTGVRHGRMCSRTANQLASGRTEVFVHKITTQDGTSCNAFLQKEILLVRGDAPFRFHWHDVRVLQ
jgi:hypothetical protein